MTNNRNHSVNVNISNGNPNDYNVAGCDGGRLAPAGQRCTIQVVFSPNAVGPQSGTLTVQGHDVSLTGRGTHEHDRRGARLHRVREPAGLHVVGLRTVTVTNNGQRERCTWAAPTVRGNNPLQFTVSDNCQAASPLAPGDQCTISVAVRANDARSHERHRSR